MRRNQKRPFFAYYSMALCHDVTDDIAEPVPYGPDGRWLSYREMAEDMDRQVGKLMAALDEMQLRKNTLILYTTDNGTAGASYLRFENGKFVRPKVISKMNGRLVQGGKGKLNDWGTRVPLIASWPGRVAAGSICDDLVDFSDFLPTMVELAETALPDESAVNGYSFGSALLGSGPTSRRWAYSEGRSGQRFLRTQDYKLYASGDFFDLGLDPEERSKLDIETLSDSTRQTYDMLRSALDSLPAPQ
jgi:arylsulfatase A